MQAKPSLACSISLAVCALLASTQAQAYLDPSTGSMLISAVVGIAASIALAVKTYWYKLKSLFRKSMPRRGDQSRGEGDS